jgi:hypothetical protein
MDHGFDEGGYAAAKQFGASLLVGGMVYKGVYHIAQAFKKTVIAYGAVTLYDLGVATCFYCFHYFTGTPDSFETAVVPPLIAAPFVYLTAHQARKR